MEPVELVLQLLRSPHLADYICVEPVELVLQLLCSLHLADLTICVEPVELVLQLLRPPHLAVPGQDQHRLLPHQQLPLRYRTDIKHNTLFFINYKKNTVKQKIRIGGRFFLSDPRFYSIHSEPACPKSFSAVRVTGFEPGTFCLSILEPYQEASTSPKEI